MISQAIPKRYARALMAYVRERKLDIGGIRTELDTAAALLDQGTDLRSFMENRQVQAASKKALLETIIKTAGFSVVAGNFLRLLLVKRRLVVLPEIRLEFQALADEAEGIVRGEVVTAGDIPDGVLDALRQKLSQVMKKDVILSVTRNPKIIGGLVVKVGSLSLDGSLRARIDSIKEQLIERVEF